MTHMLRLIAAARRGRRAVRAAATTGYHREFAALAGLRTVNSACCDRPAHADVRPLRAMWRLATRGGRPDQEPVFLAAALLAHGRDASLIIGREAAPPGREAAHLLWVEMDGQVASTGLPVKELCTPLGALPADVVADRFASR